MEDIYIFEQETDDVLSLSEMWEDVKAQVILLVDKVKRSTKAVLLSLLLSCAGSPLMAAPVFPDAVMEFSLDTDADASYARHQESACGLYQAIMSSRLDDLIEEYEAEEDVAPISVESVSNFRLFLSFLTDDSLLEGWSLFSNDRGALTLEYKAQNNIASVICIAETQMSYFVDKDRHTFIKGVEPFSTANVEYVLRKVRG